MKEYKNGPVFYVTNQCLFPAGDIPMVEQAASLSQTETPASDTSVVEGVDSLSQVKAESVYSEGQRYIERFYDWHCNAWTDIVREVPAGTVYVEISTTSRTRNVSKFWANYQKLVKEARPPLPPIRKK
jgi:hypothetical protein